MAVFLKEWDSTYSGTVRTQEELERYRKVVDYYANKHGYKSVSRILETLETSIGTHVISECWVEDLDGLPVDYTYVKVSIISPEEQEEMRKNRRDVYEVNGERYRKL